MADVTPGEVTPETVVETTTSPESPETQEQEKPVEAAPEKPAKTYSQDEYEAAIAKRLSKESRRLERIARAEAEATFWKQKAEEATRVTQQPQGKPKPEEFKDYESFMEAMTDWKVDQKLSKQRETSQQETQTQQQQRQHYERLNFVEQNLLQKGEAKYDDFREVVMGNVPITEAMVEAATRLPNGSDVLYQIAQNPAEVMRIAQLSPVQQVWEMKDLSSKLGASPKPTQTPPPIEPGASRGSVKKDTFELGTGSKEWNEYIKRRRTELGR